MKRSKVGQPGPFARIVSRRVVLFMSIAAAVTYAVPDGDITLLLDKAIIGADARLDLSITGGKVDPLVLGFTGQTATPEVLYVPALLGSTVAATTASVHVKGSPDPGVSAEYRADFAVSGPSVTGTYSGTFFDMPFSGKVTGWFIPRVAGHTDPPAGKHPRLGGGTAPIYTTLLHRADEAGGAGIADDMVDAIRNIDSKFNSMSLEEKQELYGYLRRYIVPARGSGGVSHTAVMFTGVGAAAAMLFLNEPPLLHTRPTRPSEARLLPPLAAVPTNAPVNSFTGGVMPAPMVGGSSANIDQMSPASEVGRCKYGNSFMLAPGTTAPYNAISTYGMVPKSGSMTKYYACVIDNDKPRTIVCHPNGDWHFMRSQMWLNDIEVKEGETLRLEKGMYKFVVKVFICYGLLTIDPHLSEFTDLDYQAAVRKYTRDSLNIAACGGKDPFPLMGIRRMVDFTRNYLNASVGDRGFTAEHYGGGEAVEVLLPLLHDWKTVKGLDVSYGTGAGPEWLLPLAMMTRLQHPKFYTSDAGELDFWKQLAYPGFIRPEFIDLYASLGGSTLRLSGLSSSEKLPVFIHDKKFDNFVFRNKWTGNDRDLVVTYLCQKNQPHSFCSAGSISIAGMNTSPWPLVGGSYTGVASWGNLEQHSESVIRSDSVILLSGGKVIGGSRAADGSGIVTASYDYFASGYFIGQNEQSTKPKVISPANLGITHTRSVAVDFSGKCGAPGLVVVADRISGAGDRGFWVQFHAAKPNPVISGSTFTVTNGATLKATLVAPVGTSFRAGWEDNGKSNACAIGTEFITVMTISGAEPPVVNVSGAGLDATIRVGSQTATFDKTRGMIKLAEYAPVETIAEGDPTVARQGALSVAGRNRVDESVSAYDLRGRGVGVYHACAIGKFAAAHRGSAGVYLVRSNAGRRAVATQKMFSTGTGR